jgi:hypothetical protein
MADSRTSPGQSFYKDLAKQARRRKKDRAACYALIETVKMLEGDERHLNDARMMVIIECLRTLLEHHEPLGVEDE